MMSLLFCGGLEARLEIEYIILEAFRVFSNSFVVSYQLHFQVTV